jgi:hypothetical protein
MKLTKIAGECPDKINCPAVYLTDRGTVVVRGYDIDDSEAHAQMNLPAGEGATEIPLSLLRQAMKGVQ